MFHKLSGLPMWISRREFDKYVETQKDSHNFIHTELNLLEQKIDKHDERQEEQHKENQKLLMRISFMAITGLGAALWELLLKHLHLVLLLSVLLLPAISIA